VDFKFWFLYSSLQVRSLLIDSTWFNYENSKQSEFPNSMEALVSTVFRPESHHQLEGRTGLDIKVLWQKISHWHFKTKLRCKLLGTSRCSTSSKKVFTETKNNEFQSVVYEPARAETMTEIWVRNGKIFFWFRKRWLQIHFQILLKKTNLMICSWTEFGSQSTHCAA